jgi:hypothetical protein
VVIQTLGYETMCVTVMFAGLACGTQLPLYVILNSKEQLPRGIIVRC